MYYSPYASSDIRAYDHANTSTIFRTYAIANGIPYSFAKRCPHCRSHFRTDSDTNCFPDCISHSSAVFFSDGDSD